MGYKVTAWGYRQGAPRPVQSWPSGTSNTCGRALLAHVDESIYVDAMLEHFTYFHDDPEDNFLRVAGNMPVVANMAQAEAREFGQQD